MESLRFQSAFEPGNINIAPTSVPSSSIDAQPEVEGRARAALEVDRPHAVTFQVRGFNVEGSDKIPDLRNPLVDGSFRSVGRDIEHVEGALVEFMFLT